MRKGILVALGKGMWNNGLYAWMIINGVRLKGSKEKNILNNLDLDVQLFILHISKPNNSLLECSMGSSRSISSST